MACACVRRIGNPMELTAILSLNEQWKKKLENHNIIGLVSMDLSKAFDTVSVLCISNIKYKISSIFVPCSLILTKSH